MSKGVQVSNSLASHTAPCIKCYLCYPEISIGFSPRISWKAQIEQKHTQSDDFCPPVLRLEQGLSLLRVVGLYLVTAAARLLERQATELLSVCPLDGYSVTCPRCGKDLGLTQLLALSRELAGPCVCLLPPAKTRAACRRRLRGNTPCAHRAFSLERDGCRC